MATTAAPPAEAPASKPSRASAVASGTTSKKDIPRFGFMWTVMRSIGDMSLPFFYSSLALPPPPSPFPSYTTPVILCSTHASTILDVAILASHYPERRPLHFWAKAGFFKSRFGRFILTSSGNIKVDRRNKNNQTLFEGTFEAMKAGGAIALFPEGGSYTIPKMANLKLGAAWAALEYSRYLQLEQQKSGGSVKVEDTGVKIVPAAVVFDDKSKFRSRAMLRFGKPISLDMYIEEFLSASSPSPSINPQQKKVEEDGTVPATPESMTRTNTTTGEKVEEKFASPAHRAVARLTADLQKAMEELTFNAPDWASFHAVKAARDLIWELEPKKSSVTQVREDMEEFVPVSRALLSLLSLKARQSDEARQALFTYSSLLHLANVDNVTVARTMRRGFWSTLKSFLFRLPLYLPVYGLTLLPTYVLPNAIAHHYAKREEESLSSVKTIISFLFTTVLYSTLLVKVMQWAKWSPPGLLVGIAGIYLLHDLNKGCIDEAYSLVKQLRFGWRCQRAGAGLKSQNGGSGSGNKMETLEECEKEKGHSLFFYGTLVHPKILARVIGNNGAHLTVQNAVLEGATLYHVKGQEYPGLLRTPPPSCVKGTLVTGLTSADVRCLDAFEGDEYTRTQFSVIPDPQAPVERNSDRVANAGGVALHSILAKLTKERMEELVESTKSRVKAEVYAWTAGESKLRKDVWEFDRFAREKAQNWVGEDKVEHEHEYQKVDSIRSEVTSTSILTSTPAGRATPTDEKEERSVDWVDARVIRLLESEGARAERVRRAVVKVVKQLQEKPSIQYYVDKAFGEGETRPALDHPHLLTALFAARTQARESLQALVASLDAASQRDEMQQALDTIVSVKASALRKVGMDIGVGADAAWPFTQAQLEAFATDSWNNRKSV